MPDIIDVIGKIRGSGLDFPIFPDVVPIDFNSDCWKYKLMSKAIQHTKDGQDMIIESWRVNLYTKANYTATINQPYESTYGSTHVFIGQDVAGINGRVAELTDDEFEARITGIKEYYEEFTDDNVFEFDVMINSKQLANIILYSLDEANTGLKDPSGNAIYVRGTTWNSSINFSLIAISGQGWYYKQIGSIPNITIVDVKIITKNSNRLSQPGIQFYSHGQWDNLFIARGLTAAERAASTIYYVMANPSAGSEIYEGEAYIYYTKN